jgi:hypothetical protein
MVTEGDRLGRTCQALRPEFESRYSLFDDELVIDMQNILSSQHPFTSVLPRSLLFLFLI